MILRRLSLPAWLAPVVFSAAIGADAPRAVGQTTPVMAEESKTVVQLLEDVHYLNMPISTEIFDRLIDEYMNELDEQRMFFTAEDQRLFHQRYGRSLGESLRRTGNIDPAFAIYDVYRQRVQDRIPWLLAELEKEIDFTTDETFPTKRSQEPRPPWPATTAEADDLWRRFLKFELLPDLLNDKTIDEAKETVRKRYERFLKSKVEIEPELIQEIFLSTLTRMYDPHSAYFSAEAHEEFSISIGLKLTGIGAVLSSEDGYCVIRELIPGGPAKLSKELQVKDKIVAVAQGGEEAVDVIGMELRKVVKMIRGQKGTPITLTIVPVDSADNSVRRQVTLIRDVVQLNAQRAKATIQEVPIGAELVPIGVIEIPNFYGLVDEGLDAGPSFSVTSDVEELVEKLKDSGVRGIVLDLRNNGGGLLSEAISLTGLFIRSGPVVQVRTSFGEITVKTDYDAKVVYDGPLMVLTSRYSASASEIVAGALQNYGRAIVVGDSSTHGKGTVQAILEMRGMLSKSVASTARVGAAKLTIQKFYLPNGNSTQNKGVIPDVSLPAIADLLPIGEADLPNSLPWDTIEPVVFNGRQIDENLRNLLKEEALERVGSLPEFELLKRRIEWFREREQMTEVSLNLEKRRQMKEQDEAFRNELKDKEAELAALNFNKHTIPLNGVVVAEDEHSAPTIEQLMRSGDEEEDEDSPPPFDVHLREALRILCDAIQVAPDWREWSDRTKALALVTAWRQETSVPRSNN